MPERNSNLNLTYDRPATKWTEALPVGNGRIGAMVFGGTEDERLQINEDTLWGGVPHDYTNPGSHAHLDEIRQLIFAGKLDEAEKLSASLMGDPKLLMPYQPFCDLRLHFPGHGQATQYIRQLHLDDAIAETDYKVGSATFRREMFVSYPDQVLVVRLTSDKPGTHQLQPRLGLSPTGNAVSRAPTADTLELTRSNSTETKSGSILDGIVERTRDAVRRRFEGHP